MTSKNLSRDDLDPVIHAPSRLKIMGVLSAVESADFLFLLRQTGLTKGNLSAHLSKLETAGYTHIQKKFVGKIPRTLINLTEVGRSSLEAYRKQMQELLNDLK
ncbi:MAG: winged helix-turn-helix domain-containing protein [Candidatus Ranarchaeia archaeon]